MKIQLVRVGRRPNWPVRAVLLASVWLVLGGTTLLLSERFSQPVQLCLFKRLAGIPCPTCGFTRGVLAALHGHPIQGWLYNPLLLSALGVLLVVTAIRLLWGLSVRIRLARKETVIALITAITLFVINWVYVILYVG